MARCFWLLRLILVSLAFLLAAAPPPVGGSKKLGRCKNCVYVLERIKQGYYYLLPNICEEILTKTEKNDEYATCHKMLASLSQWGLSVRHWMHRGCYRTEPYGAVSLVQPCPSHVICSKITDVDKQAFCSDILTDFTGKNAKKSSLPKT